MSGRWAWDAGLVGGGAQGVLAAVYFRPDGPKPLPLSIDIKGL